MRAIAAHGNAEQQIAVLAHDIDRVWITVSAVL